MTRRPIKADLAVIGAGSGGLSVAAGAAQLGLEVVLFEKEEMGGDCLNYGCVPSKALLAAADAAASLRRATRLGITAREMEIDFAAVMAHVKGTIAAIAPVDSQERFEALGVTVLREAARFTGPRELESDSFRVKARKIVIATGSRPKIPPIPGLAEIPHLTNETIFDLEVRPQRLIVLGGGPIGMELGQAFRRLGSEVVVIEASDPLAHEERDLAQVVVDQLRADGVEILTGAKVVGAEPGPVLVVETAGGEHRVSGSHILVALGRAPVLEGLGLEKAGVAYDAKGVRTDRMLRSSNTSVFAVGDAAGREQFTHLAAAHAALVVRRALFALPVDADRLVVPRVTYTDPELAAVGLTEAEARRAHGAGVRTVTWNFEHNDRAQTEGDLRGFARLVTDARGKVLGAALVGRHAGEHIHLWALAISGQVKLRALTGMIAPYPTRGEINKRLASQWYAPALFSRRTRKLVSVLKHLA